MNILGREDLRKQLQKKEIAPVYVLFGAETYLRDLATKTITEIALKDAALREFNENSYNLNETYLADALAAAEQLPLMNLYRVITITNVRITEKRENLKEDNFELLEKYLKNPVKSSVLIFSVEDIDKRRKIAKLLLENSIAVEFVSLKDAETFSFIRQKMSELKVKADEQTLQKIVLLVGNNVRKLLNELEKLSVAALPEGIITGELVEKLISNSREISNFDLSNHLLNKNRQKAFQVLRKILHDGAEPLMLLGLIANNFHRLFLAKELMKQGVERYEVARIMKLPPFKQEEFLATARRAEVSKLSWILQRIAETDLAIKTSQATPELQIELLVYELTA